MSMDEAWSFLKMRKAAYVPPHHPPRQSKVHEWGAMPKPLGEMTQSFVPAGKQAFNPSMGASRYSGGFPWQTLGPNRDFQTADLHDLVPLGDAPPKPPETTESKREHLMGLKPSQFHLTSTRTVHPWGRPEGGWKVGDSEGRYVHDKHQSQLDRAYENIKHFQTHGDFSEDEHGMLDEMIGESMEGRFGEKQYALHAPIEALPSDYAQSAGLAGMDWEEENRNTLAPHSKHLEGKMPVGYATMEGPHVSYMRMHPDLRGRGLGRLLGEQILGREGGLISALRTEHGEGLANKFLSLLPNKLGSAAARKFGRLPRHAEVGALHNMRGRNPNDLDMHTSISHAHLPEKWGSLRPDISTVPYSEELSTKLANGRPRGYPLNPSQSDAYGEWPSTRHVPDSAQTRLTEPSMQGGRYWKDIWDKQQDRLTQEAWDKIGSSERPWGANEPSNWRTSQQIPWHMRHLFREDEFHGNEPEQINEPSDYAYDPETQYASPSGESYGTLQDWVDTWE